MTNPQESKFAITPTEDQNNSIWVWDFSISHSRMLRQSVSEWANPETGDRTIFYNIKIFRVDSNNPAAGVKQCQQISLTSTEGIDLLRKVTYYRFEIIKQLKNEDINCGTINYQKGIPFQSITDTMDESECHWFKDIYESKRRKLRISYIVHDNEKPDSSTYVQLKLFTRAQEDKEYTKRNQVSMSQRELRQLSEGNPEMIDTIRAFVHRL